MTYTLLHGGKPIGSADSAANAIRAARFLRSECLDGYDGIPADEEGEHRPADLDDEQLHRLEDDPEPDDASHLTAYDVGLPATY